MNDSPMIRVWFDDHREPVLFRNYEAAMNSMKNSPRTQANLREHWKAFATLEQKEHANYLEQIDSEDAKQSIGLIMSGVIDCVHANIHDLARAAYGSAPKNFEDVHVEFLGLKFHIYWRGSHDDYDEGVVFYDVPSMLEWLQKWAEQGKIEQITLERRLEINTKRLYRER
jgi:hypothetical protein